MTLILSIIGGIAVCLIFVLLGLGLAAKHCGGLGPGGTP